MSEAPAPVDLLKLDQAGFDKLYNERIKPCYDAYEPEREAGVATFRRRLGIGGAITVALVIAVMAFARTLTPTVIAGLMGALLTYGWAYAKLGEVQQKVKQASCAAVAQAIGVTYTMAGFAPAAFDRFRALNLLPNFDRSHFEDQFHGDFDRSAFDLYEAKLEQRHTDSKGRTSWSTVFQGQLIRLKFPRDFLGVTIVRRDAGLFNFMNGGAQGLKKVGLEDPMFEKAFEVYGTDQVEARYLLQPVLMQHLVDLETILTGKKLRCAFENGDLIIAVEGGDLFEPGDMFKPLADPVRARHIVDDVAGVLRIMDHILDAQTARVA